MEQGLQRFDIEAAALGPDFHGSVRAISHPAIDVQFAGLAEYKVAEANTLHSAGNGEFLSGHLSRIHRRIE